ncbi:neuropeptide F receptor-like [Gigantopelta aegis]|uniref:neuropeptide F receptor-like n=1 Tax=Gigantopelta aegis TaxID=1735272 RepID=UPI001B88BC7D|nr:neuropeptide F receptor-like [Gigantopelta aegis]
MEAVNQTVIISYSDTSAQNASVIHDFNQQLYIQILQQNINAKYFNPPVEIVLSLAYGLLITFGALGNGLVCHVVARNAHMRTPRNIFIINLAISDFTLCLFTQPLNLYKLMYVQWSLGSLMCKFVTMFQGTNVFVSTISITAIALDRFQVIVYPTKDSMKKVGAAVALVSIWVISFLMASPFLLFSIIEENRPMEEYDISFYRCIEDTSLSVEKRAYSVAQMVVQYVMPIIIIGVAHFRICNKLRYRMANQKGGPVQSSPYQRKKNERNCRRKRKTNILLTMIAIVFALSWLPLNIFNLLSEFNFNVFQGSGSNGADSANLDINLAYAICHMLVLSSACLNPVLYGWLNENFRTEFVKVFSCTCCAMSRNKMNSLRNPNGERPNVPAITLTKATNGSSVVHDQVDEDGVTENGITELAALKP